LDKSVSGWRYLCSDIIACAVTDIRLSDEKCSNSKKFWNLRSSALQFLFDQTHPAFEWVNVDCEVLKEEVDRIVGRNPSFLLSWE